MREDSNISQKIAEEYWIKKLEGVTLDSDLVHPPAETGAVANESLLSKEFPKDVSETLTALFQGPNAEDNRFLLLLTAFNIIANRYSHATDMVVGVPAGGTTVYLRLDAPPESTVRQLMKQTQENYIEALKHSDVDGEKLKRRISANQSADSAAIDAILFYYSPLSLPPAEETAALQIGIVKTESGFTLDIKGNPARVTVPILDFFAEAFIHTLGLLPDHRTSAVKELDLLPPREQDLLLHQFPYSKNHLTIDKTVVELFQQQVKRTPGKVAVVFENSHLTYDELNRRVNRLARFLTHRGIGRDSLVAMLLDRSFDMIIAAMAILKAGGAYVPIDTSYPQNRIVSILNESAVDLVISDQSIGGQLDFTSLVNIREDMVEPVLSPPRPQILDFDSIPIPDRTLIDYQRYHNHIGMSKARHTITLQATRGCPYNCIYCHKIWPKNNVHRSAENIFQEIKNCYECGIRRFVFIDDIFNLNVKNSGRLLETIIKEGLDIKLYFPHGLRGDILTEEFIDLLVEAGCVNIAIALETTSPRIQKLMRKNLDIDRYLHNIRYISSKYPHVVLTMQILHGFPTETEAEALATLEMMKSIRWLHFCDLNILKVFPNSEMYDFAVANGVSHEAIERSTDLLFNELPETLPYPKSFTLQYQSRYLNEYFLNKERLLHVLPHQIRISTEEELAQMYDSHVPMRIGSLDDLLSYAEIDREELGDIQFLKEEEIAVPDFSQQIKSYFPVRKPDSDALKILLLDTTVEFSTHDSNFYDMIEAPLGLMSLVASLNGAYGSKIDGKVMKSMVDYDSFDELRATIEEFQPDIIGLRSLSHYKQFFHETVSLIRQWGFANPIIAGGPYATTDYRFALQDANIDVVVIGEGEHTFTELIGAFLDNHKTLPAPSTLTTIKGLAFVPETSKAILRKERRQLLVMDHIKPQLETLPDSNPQCPAQLDDLAFVIYTSGSTGIPKGVLQTHRCLANTSMRQAYFGGFQPELNVLQYMSISFDASIAHEILFAYLSGGTLFLINEEIRKNLELLGEFLIKHRIQSAMLPASVLNIIFELSDGLRNGSHSLNHLISAGEQLTVGTSLEQFLRANPQCKLHNFYGPSETHNAANHVLDPESGVFETYQPIGTPTINAAIFLLDKHQHPVPMGVRGEAYISGFGLARGYLNHPDMTAERFVSHPLKPGELAYKSGDLAKWLPDGRLVFTGRIDKQVKIRGFRIELQEIENALLKYRTIKDAVAIIREENERYIAAYYISEQDIDSADLRYFLGQRLPEYMLPAYFVPVKSFPLTANGKVDHNALPVPSAMGGKDYIPPEGETERQMVEIWAQVLGVDGSGIGRYANFFELGGHSLKATILVARIHKVFNTRVPLVEIFKQPTLKHCAAVVDSAKGKTKIRPIKAAATQPSYPLSPNQQRLYLTQQRHPHSTAYNMPGIFHVDEPLDVAALEQAFQEIIRRHEIYRTYYEMDGGHLVQKVMANVSFNIEHINDDLRTDDDIAALAILPFDLSRPPLLRVTVIDRSAGKQILVVDQHHIVTDGVSIRLFVKELFKLYRGYSLPAVDLQYKDYCVWLEEQASNPQWQEQERFWTSQFADKPAPLNLPLDFQRPAERQFNGRMHIHTFEAALSQRLRELAQREGVTLFILLLTIYNVLLSKLSNQEDIVVGTTVAGRQYAGLESIMGMFVNTLALRNRPAGKKTFSQFLDEVRELTVKAFDYQDYPFERLVEKTSAHADRNRNPLFDYVFELRNLDDRLQGIDKDLVIPLTPIKPSDQRIAAKFDLTVVAFEEGARLGFEFIYDTALFTAGTIERMGLAFQRIADLAAQRPDITLEELDIVSEQRRDEVTARMSDDLEDE